MTLIVGEIMKKILSLILILSVMTASIQVSADSYNDINKLQTVIEGIISWQGSIIENENEHIGENAVDWIMFGKGRMGVDIGSYAQDTANYFNKNFDKLTLPDKQRLSLVCAAGGVDIDGNGMLDSVANDFKDSDLSGRLINHLIFTLHVIDCGRYNLSDEKNSLRENLIAEILSRQLDSGALYMMSESTPETDVTAMALTALAPYACMDKKTAAACEKMLDFLSSVQADDGTMKNWGASSCETTCQMIVGLCTLGIDPLSDERFIKDGKTLIDGLMSYRQEDGGFAHNAESSKSDAYASSQALYALVGYVRFINGYRSLFDMRQEQSDKLHSEIKKLRESCINDTPDQSVFDDIAAIPSSERMYLGFECWKYLSDYPESLPKEDNDIYGTSAAVNVFLPRVTFESQTLTARDSTVSVLETTSVIADDTSRSKTTAAETVILITIALAAACGIIYNHTVLKKKL